MPTPLSERVAVLQRAAGYSVWPALPRGPYPAFGDPPESMDQSSLVSLDDAQHLMSVGLYGLARRRVRDAINVVERWGVDQSEEASEWLADTYERLGSMAALPVPTGGNARDRRRYARTARRLFRSLM